MGGSMTEEAKVEEFSLALRVKLTEDEIKTRAERSADLVGKLERQELEAKSTAKALKSHIEQLKVELQALSCEVREKSAFREVNCRREFNYRTGTVSEIRCDTGEVITQRPLRDYERQLPLQAQANDTIPVPEDESSEPESHPAIPPPPPTPKRRKTSASKAKRRWRASPPGAA